MSLTERYLSRSAAIDELRQRLVRESFPRITVLIIVSLAGGAAFLFSVLALSAGLSSMPVRYGLAALAGYLMFVLLLRAWIAMKRGSLDLDVEVPDFGGPSRGSAESPRMFSGGGSGGGGASSAWEAPAVEAAAPRVAVAPRPVAAGGGRSGSSVFDSLDLDKLWLVILAAALAAASLAAVVFVVYSAPLLLAEVALDAGVMSTVYRRLRRQDVGHWTGAVFRRTWLPATVVVTFMAGAGYLLQLAVPEARSIGGVLRALGL